MQVDSVDSHIVLGALLEDHGRPDEAEILLHKAVELAERCAAEHPSDQRWRLEVFRAQAALGRVQLMRQDIAAAIETMLPAVKLLAELEERVSADEFWRGMLESFYFDLCFALSHQVNYSMRIDQIQRGALASVRRRCEREPADVGRAWMLAGFCLQRAELLESEDIWGAKEAAQQALELVVRLPVRDEDDAETKRKIERLRPLVRKPRKKRRSTKG